MKVLTSYGWIAEEFEDVKEDGGGTYVSAQCPIHRHRTATLRFWCGESGTLVSKCWSGKCDRWEILRAVGRGWKDCFPADTDWSQVKREITARYPYHDQDKRVLYETCRLEPGFGGKDKTFFQRRPDGRGGWINSLGDATRVLYRLPDILKAGPDSLTFICAGEKDCDTLRSLGLLATTNVCGERAEWLPSYSETLADRDVVVVQDNDGTGVRHANEVCGALMLYARSVRRVALPQKDATAFVNHLRASGVTDKDDILAALWAAVEQYPKWEAVREQICTGADS